MDLASETQASPVERSSRRLPVGAEYLPNSGVSFRVWAPKRQCVTVVFEDEGLADLPLARDDGGYFAGVCADARPGARYQLRLDDEPRLYPDPVSRYQPDGPHGTSEVVDPDAFTWSDAEWRGLSAAGQVLYELHIGTFTKGGTWASAIEELPNLKELGITCIELMPVNEFAGRFGWGYDGVGLFAPFHHYGQPDDMRRFIDRAHQLGLAVILDVVYNHFGPDGNYVTAFSDHYLSDKHCTDWGDAINFDGESCQAVREFFVSNARYWITEFHLDGFRIDATQAIVDDSKRHILAEITESARQAAADRKLYIINENEPQLTKLVRPIDQGGYGMDALWNDDFHHSAMVALSGHNEAYYMDYLARPQEFISAAKWGYLYQGQWYKWQKRRRGSPALDLPPTAFVHFIQNHDQIANSARGLRAHQIASPAQLRAMTALLLLMPQTPMLFQGQEFAASSTFHYFADHNEDVRKMVCAGRAKELSAFPSIATPNMQACLIDPGDNATFERSQIDHAERNLPYHSQIYRLHKDLLRLRREEPAFRRVQQRGDIDGAVLEPDAFVLRFFAAEHDDRLVLVNFGKDLIFIPSPEPLLATPFGRRWSIVWSSEDPIYGGSGTAPVDTEEEGWFLPGRCTVVLKPLPAAEAVVISRRVVAGSAQEARLRENARG